VARQYVSGFNEVAKILKELPRAAESRVLQASTQAGARALAKEVKANAPRHTGKRSQASKQYGTLFRNIKVQPLRWARRRRNIRGSRVYTGNAFWGVFLELGTRFITAKPWFRPAISTGSDAALNAIKSALGRGVDREAAKLAQKYRTK